VLVVLDLAILYFQVPSELSAPNIPMAVIAALITSFATVLCIVSSFSDSDCVQGSCMEFKGGFEDHTVGGNTTFG
jgi:hypothetical protein